MNSPTRKYTHVGTETAEAIQALTDPEQIREYHQQGLEWYRKAIMTAVTSGQPAAIMTVTMLTPNQVTSVEDGPLRWLEQGGTPTLGVGGNGTMIINGVFTCHPGGMIKGDSRIAQSLLLHEGIHPMMLHPTRMTRHLRNLQAAGRIGDGCVLDMQAASHLWNGVADVYDDDIGAEVAQTSGLYNSLVLTEHGEEVAEILRQTIADYGVTLDPGRFVQDMVQKRSNVEALVELFLDNLPDDECDDGPEGDCDEGEGEGDSEGESDGEGEGDDGGDDGDDSDGDSDNDSDGDDSGDGGGSGSGGAGAGDSRDGGGSIRESLSRIPEHIKPLEQSSDSELAAQETETAARVVLAAKQAGTGTAFDRLVDHASQYLETAQVSWRDKFQASMDSISEELSYENQYQPSLAEHDDPILPDYKPGVGAIAVAIDTSGSVWYDDVLRKELLTEVQELLETVPFERVYLMPVDTEVKGFIEIAPGDPLPLSKVHGGGGTYFHPPFQYLEDNRIDVDALVYCTDGYARVDFDEPDYPVIWLTGTNSIDDYLKWGEVINRND